MLSSPVPAAGSSPAGPDCAGGGDGRRCDGGGGGADGGSGPAAAAAAADCRTAAAASDGVDWRFCYCCWPESASTVFGNR